MSRAFVIVLAVLITACGSEAQSPSTFPQSQDEGGRVRDGADVLSADAEMQLTAMLDEAELAYGPQMAIVTVDTLGGKSIAEFSLEYAREWGLGDAERADGLLLLVAPNEREVRIEVGYGMEHSFSDEYCAEVLRDTVLPRFAEGEFETGVLDGTTVMIEKMRQVPSIPANDNQSSETMMEDAA